LYIELTSMHNIWNNHTDIASCLISIVPERGKMPTLPNSGGLLLGRVKDVGEAVQKKLGINVGSRVIPLCSITNLPLRISGVGDVVGDQLVNFTGDAISFGSVSFITVPDDLDPGLALVVVDIASTLSHIERFVAPLDTVLILGCGKIGLTALCYIRKLAPKSKILCVDISDAKLEIASSFNKADVVAKVNTQNPLDMLGFIRKHTNNQGAELVLNCAPDSEASSVLTARSGGNVILCSSTQSVSMHTVPSRDVCVVLGGGYRSLHTAQIFDLVRVDKQLYTVLLAFSKIT